MKEGGGAADAVRHMNVFFIGLCSANQIVTTVTVKVLGKTSLEPLGAVGAWISFKKSFLLHQCKSRSIPGRRTIHA